ncbi:hypothetical protein D3C87_1491100 [compost metagenome]
MTTDADQNQSGAIPTMLFFQCRNQIKKIFVELIKLTFKTQIAGFAQVRRSLGICKNQIRNIDKRKIRGRASIGLYPGQKTFAGFFKGLVERGQSRCKVVVKKFKALIQSCFSQNRSAAREKTSSVVLS